MSLHKLVFLFLLVSASFNKTFAQFSDSAKVNQVFIQFQSGYTKRDTSKTEQFASTLFSKDILIIGIGSDEWIQGMDAAKNLVKNDWAYWMNLKIDTSSIKITILGNNAIFAMKGVTSISFPTKDIAYDFAAQQMQRVVSGEKSAKGKLLAYSRESSDWIREIERGGLSAAYEIRMAGTLIKKENKWLFQQLIFSYPYPMVRKG